MLGSGRVPILIGPIGQLKLEDDDQRPEVGSHFDVVPADAEQWSKEKKPSVFWVIGGYLRKFRSDPDILGKFVYLKIQVGDFFQVNNGLFWRCLGSHKT